jgi:hypothetical protein
VVIGRRVFDITDGWDGVPAAGEHVFVGAMGAGDVVPLDNPTRVVQGDRVTHLLYDVSRPSTRP